MPNNRLELRTRVALAIERADNQKVPDGYGDVIGHAEVSDWGVYLADAAIEAIERLSTGSEASLRELAECLKSTVHLARTYAGGTGSIFTDAMMDAERLADRTLLERRGAGLREPTEAMVEAGLKDLRDRGLLKYLFTDCPEDVGAYGYVDHPFDLEVQREIVSTIYSVMNRAASAGLKGIAQPQPESDNG